MSPNFNCVLIAQRSNSWYLNAFGDFGDCFWFCRKTKNSDPWTKFNLLSLISDNFSSFWRWHQGGLDSWAQALPHDRRGEQAEEWTGKVFIWFFKRQILKQAEVKFWLYFLFSSDKNVSTSSRAIALFTRLQVVDFPNWICALPKLNLVEAKTPTSWKFCSGQGTRGGGEGAVPQVPRQVHRRKLPQEGWTDITLENFPLRILQSKGMFGFNLVKMEGKVRENRACNWICLFRSLKKTQQAMRFPAGKGKC